MHVVKVATLILWVAVFTYVNAVDSTIVLRKGVNGFNGILDAYITAVTDHNTNDEPLLNMMFSAWTCPT